MGLFREHSKAKTTKASTTTPTNRNNPHQASSTSRNSDASSSPNNLHNNNESSTLSSFSPGNNGRSPSTTSSQQEGFNSKRRLRDPKASKLRKLQRKQKLSRAISTPFRTLFHYHHTTEDNNNEEEPSSEPAVVASSSSPTRSAIHNETDYPCQMVADRRRSSYGKNKSAKSLIQLGVDLEREKTRLESFEAYVLVSILTASASFSVLDAGTSSSGGTSMPTVFHHHPHPQQYAAAGECPYYYPDHTAIHDDNNDKIDWVHTLTMFAAGLSAICGLHATIVFSLCVLYGKTALGLKKDVAYDGFLRQVAAQRIRGFNTFSASLLLFAVECALLLYTHVPSQYALIALVVALSSTLAIVRDWYALVHAATTQIFQSQTDQAPGASQSFMEFSQDDDDDEEEEEEEEEETNVTEDEGSMRQKDSNGKEEREPLNGHHGHSIDNNKTARRRPKLHNEEDEDETESRTNQSKSKMVHYNDEDDDEEELDGSLVSGGR